MSVRRFFIFLLFLIPLLTYGQSERRLGRARLTKSFDYVTLAHELTDHLPNDSLKVKAIYIWMTRHIDYDVWGLTYNGGSYTKPNDILQHRKSVCLGYNILFDSMCSVIGIECEPVYGYVYMPWYEVGDTFFLDSHAWNAVNINGEWELIDATWGAGYIKQRKQRIAKFLYRRFRVPYRTKYHFKQKTNMKYFCTPPEVMVLDHLPSTPAWQLLDCSVPIDSFQRTPQGTIDHLAGPNVCENGNDSIAVIQSHEQQDHLYVAGTQALATNKQNHQDITLGQWHRIDYLSAMARDTLFSLEERIAMYDSLIVMADSLILYNKRTSKDAILEGQFFERRNRRMKAQTEKETKPQLRKHKKAIDEIKKERFLIRKQVQKLKRENKRLKLENKRARKKKIKVKRPKSTVPAMEALRDSILLDLEENFDSVAIRKDEMLEVSYYNYTDEIVYYDSLVAQKKRRLRLQYLDMREVNFYRNLSFTCYDTCVFTPKRQFLQTQKELDSLQLLLPRPGKWRVDTAAKAYKVYATDAKSRLKMNMSYYKMIARLPESSINEVAGFDSCRSEIVAINDSIREHNRERIRDLKHYQKRLRKFRWMHYKVKWSLQAELRNEAWRYVVTKNFFRKYYKGVAAMFRNNTNLARGMKTDFKQKKQALIRKKRKQDKLKSNN